MKSKLLAALLAACLSLTMAACGTTKNPAAGESVPSETAPQRFGNVAESAPAETARTTDLPGSGLERTGSQEPSVQAEDSDAEYRLQQTLRAIDGVLYCDAVDQLSFSPDDPMYFWRAVGYMAGLLAYEGPIPAGSQISIGDNGVEAFAGVLGYTGEIPSLTEEDPLISRNPDDTDQPYLVILPEMGKIEGEYSDPVDNGDGTYTMEAELFQDGTALGRYTVVVKDCIGDRALFDYTIVSVEELF